MGGGVVWWGGNPRRSWREPLWSVGDVQILVVVANIQWRTLKAEVEKVSCVNSIFGQWVSRS